MCTLVSPIIIGQKCPFNTPLTHFPLFHFLFPTQFHFINILLFIFFHFTNIQLTFFHFTIIKPTSKIKIKIKKEMKKSSSVQWRIKQLFARYNNFILLNSYLFLNIFEYEVNLFFICINFFLFILKYDVDCFNLVLI